MRRILLAALALGSANAAAQTMYKCMDGQNQVTYSNITCEKQGLKNAGTVTADRVTTMPSGPAPLPTQKLKPPVEMPKDLEKNSK